MSDWQPIELTDEQIDASLSPSVSRDCPAARNMRYLRLRNYEYQMHEDLMQTAIRDWPESLKELADARQKQYGLCGEVISAAVADWIRGVRVMPLPAPPVPAPEGQ